MTGEQTPLLKKPTKFSVNGSKSTDVKLAAAATLAIGLFATEVYLGYRANSLALLSDAFQLLMDVVHIIFIFATFSSLKWYIAKVITSLVTMVILYGVRAALFVGAFYRLIKSPQDVDARLMYFAAAISLLINVIISGLLATMSNGHHRQQSDEEANDSHDKDDNNNLRSDILYILKDQIVLLGIFACSVLLMFKSRYTFVDPVFTIIISVISFHSHRQSLIQNSLVLMKAEGLEKAISKIPEVVAVPDLQLWEQSPREYEVSGLIIANDRSKYDDINFHILQLTMRRFNIRHTNFRIEPVQ